MENELMLWLNWIKISMGALGMWLKALGTVLFAEKNLYNNHE
jgi:hypothetical protein